MHGTPAGRVRHRPQIFEIEALRGEFTDAVMMPGSRGSPPGPRFPARSGRTSASWPMSCAGGQGTVVLMRWTWSPNGGGTTSVAISTRRSRGSPGQDCRPGWEIPPPAAYAGHVADDPGTGMGTPWNQ